MEDGKRKMEKGKRKKEDGRRKSEEGRWKNYPTLPLSPSPPLPLSRFSPSLTLRCPKAGSAKSQVAELFNDMEIIGCNQKIDR
jgi:hypothetical protein